METIYEKVFSRIKIATGIIFYHVIAVSTCTTYAIVIVTNLNRNRKNERLA